MKIRKDMIFAVLTTFCLNALMFAVIPIRGGSSYDPWMDINDDGKIDMTDIGKVAFVYSTSGDAINKTALLINCSDTFNQLLNRIATLNSSLTELKQTNVLLQSQIDALNSRVNALEANYSVTNLDLAPCAIPFNWTCTSSDCYTTETWPNWADMPNMSLTLTLNRTSQLIIVCNIQGQNIETGDAPETTYTYLQALVNGGQVQPSVAEAFPTVQPQGMTIPYLPYHSHYLRYGSYSYNFYSETIGPGVYTIKIQWDVTAGKAEAHWRSLSVMALPA